MKPKVPRKIQETFDGSSGYHALSRTETSVTSHRVNVMQVNQRYLSHFKGKNVLVVEDEYFLADETRRALQALGANVVGPAANVADALDLLSAEVVDAAILDVHLGDELVFPVAEKLEEDDIPYVFATGYDPSIIPGRFNGFTLSAKPIDLSKIAAALFAPSSNEH